MNIAPAFANKYMLKISGTAVIEEIVGLGTATKITCLDGLRYSFLLSSDGTIPAGMRLVRRGKNLLIEVDGQIVLVLVNFYSVNGTSFVVDAAGETVTAETDKLRSLTDSDDLIWVAQDPKGGLFGGAGGMGAALAGLAIAASAGGSTPENVVVGGLDVDSVTDRYLSDGKALIVTLPANATAGQTIRVKVYLDSGLVDTIEHILTSGDIANGSVQINLPADDITVDLGTYSATIDLLNSATLLNTTTIDNVYVNDGDNGMSLALDGDTNPYDGLNCVITLPSSALAGDTIRTLIYIEGSFDPVGTVETVLTADDITAGVLHQLMTVLDVSRDAQYNGQSLCLAPDGSQRESTEADGLFTIYDGLVVDDYLAGAQVFIDRNRNNQ